MATGNIIKIFNRAPYPLTAMKDGRSYPIPVGFCYVTSDVVSYAKDQNIIYGTEDPATGQFESLVSVVADDPALQRDPLDAVPEEVITAMKERVNRSMLDPDRRTNVDVLHTMFPRPRSRVGVENPSVGMSDPGKFQ